MRMLFANYLKMKQIKSHLANGMRIKLDTIMLLVQSIKIAMTSPLILLYIFLSIVVTIFIFVALFAITFWRMEVYLEQFIEYLSLTYSWSATIIWTFRTIFIISFIFIMYFSFSILGLIILLPFLDLISEKTELLINGCSDCDCSFFKGLFESFKSISIITLKKILILIITLPLLFIPIIGFIIFFIINSLNTTYEFLDIPMARRGWSYKDKKKFLENNTTKYERFIFGATVRILMLIPFVNLIMYPIYTIAGTIFFLKIQEKNKEL